MKKLTQFSVNYPVTILMLVMAILLLGYISFSKLGIDLFPNINNPKLFIELKAGQRAPEEIENLYVDKIESQALRQSDVVSVSSVTKVGESQITVEYSWSKDMDGAYLDLQKALNTFNQNAGLDELNISQYDPNASPVMIVAMENDSISDLNEIRKVAESYVRNEIIRVEGIADVTLAGQEIGEVVVQTDPYLLEAYGLTAAQLSQKIGNYNKDVSGGTIEEMGTKYNIKGISMITSPSDLNRIIVSYTKQTALDGTVSEVPVYLQDVAKVIPKNKDPESIVRINGKRCLGLSVFKEPKYNTVKAVDALKKELIVVEKALPGYKLTVVKDQGTFISSAIGEVNNSAYMGMFLAIIVLFVFLRRISSTLVIGVAIPISIIATFTLMYFKGLTLNIMTLGGLALGAGMLVDNAIVVVENIYRNMQKGKSVVQAAIEGTAEVGGAITASTLTTIVVFLPIVYMQGASGELFKDQAWTVSFSLLASLVVAILVIPVLVTKFFKGEKKITSEKALTFKWYPALLSKILNRKWTVVSISIVAIIASYFALPLIGSEFMPRTTSDNLKVEIKLPEGSRLLRTSSTLEIIEKMVKSQMSDDISLIYTEVGTNASANTSTGTIVEENTGTIYIELSELGAANYNAVVTNLNEILSANSELTYSFLQDETSLQTTLGNDDPPLVVEVIGEDLTEISKITQNLKQIIAEQPGLFDVKTSIENGSPEIEIKIDRIIAGLNNITIETIITQLKERLDGTDAGQFQENGEMLDITIRQPEMTVSEIENIEIKNGNKSYRLSDLSTITQATSPREILRRNQNRIGKITAYIEGNQPYNLMVKSLSDKLNQVTLPSNYRVLIAGEEAKRKESMGSLTFALILSIILVYMVMAAQFESLIHPFTILLTIPLAMVGVVTTFLLIGQPFNIMAYIGMIMLAGIAVNNAIILVDAINQLRDEGHSRREAIIMAGHQRIRPIIMTSLTTILALIPMTISFGENASLRSPMAWAVIGGLTTSTILSLVVIPCVYEIFDRKKE